MNILQKREKYFPKCLYHSFNEPFYVETAKEQYYNNDVLDLYNNVCHIGHSNEKVLNTILNEYSTVNIHTRYINKNLVEYAENLSKYIPKGYKMLFVNSGSEANDLALQIAMNYSNKNKIASMEYSYHGTTYLCNKVSHITSKGDIKNNLPEQIVFLKRTENNIKETLKEKLKDCSCFILETIQGVGGNYNLSKILVEKIFNYCRENDILTICDEVQTGFGRTGKTFWSYENYGVFPDIITCGKSIANGYPMGTVIFREKYEIYIDKTYFNTFGGNSVACKIATVVLEEIEEKNLLKNSKELGDYLYENLVFMNGVKNVYGSGLFIGVQLEEKYDTKDIVENLKKNKIIVGIGANNIIRIKPPMIVNKNDIDMFLEKFLDILDKTLASF
jgi:4-aminobutyrate aminotransferase-like enzyme